MGVILPARRYCSLPEHPWRPAAGELIGSRPDWAASVPGMGRVVELERIAAQGWQGTTTARMGGWLLRAGGGFTGRANSVLPLGPPGVDLGTALERAADFYRVHDLPVLFQLPHDEPGMPLDDLRRQLVERGMEAFNPTPVMTPPLVTVLDRSPVPSHLPAARLDATPSAAWLSGYHYRGSPLPPAAVAVLINATGPVFATLESSRSDQPAGVARGIVTDGWLGVTAVTVPEHRRRAGVGRHLMGELARWAAGLAQPATDVYLQVDAANTAALGMYARLGFTAHHQYDYLR